MNANRADEFAARVVAWHNRHPLARRITPEHLQGVGVVSLPFSTPDGAPPEPSPEASITMRGATLRERAVARARAAPAPAETAAEPTTRDGWTAAFTERFLPGLNSSTVAQFALHHGALERSHARGPRREVMLDEGLVSAERGVQRLVLMTVSLETGRRRRRILLDATGEAILGRRLLSIPRLAALGGAPLLVAAAVVVALTWRGLEPPHPVVARPVQQAASAAMVQRTLPTRTDLPQIRPQAVAATPAALPREVPPPVVSPSTGRIDIRPRLPVELAREAKRHSAALRGGSAPVAASVAPASAAASSAIAALARPAHAAAASAAPPASEAIARTSRLASAPTSTRPASAPAHDGRTFALVSRSMRTRVAAEVMLGLMRGVTEGDAARRAEVMPAAGAWRATWWPFSSQADARRAQELLARAGLHAEIVEF